MPEKMRALDNYLPDLFTGMAAIRIFQQYAAIQSFFIIRILGSGIFSIILEFDLSFQDILIQVCPHIFTRFHISKGALHILGINQALDQSIAGRKFH